MITRDTIAAFAATTDETLSVLDDKNKPAPWAPTAVAYVIEKSTRALSEPYTKSDLEGIVKYLNNMSRLDARQRALIQSGGRKQGAGDARQGASEVLSARGTAHPLEGGRRLMGWRSGRNRET